MELLTLRQNKRCLFILENMSQPNIQAELAECKIQYDKEVSMVSNCCSARTSEPDKNNLAFCLDCKEHCIAEQEMTFEDWLDEQREYE